MYKLVKPLFENQPSSFIQRTEDGAFIPVNADNTDYQAFKKDLANGVELQDANGTAMTASEITAFLATLK